MEEALRMAREEHGTDPAITCFRIAPMLMADVTVDTPAESSVRTEDEEA